MSPTATLQTLRARIQQKTQNPLLDRGVSNTGTDSSLSGTRESVQVEPKTYFANERTFIQWISAALLLLTVSSIMMGSGNYNGTSSVIALSSLILVVYAAFVYFRRVKLLQTGQGYGYLDFVGPSILALGVGLGVSIVFADSIKGSEFVPWGGGGKEQDDRRVLTKMAPITSSLLPKTPPLLVQEQDGLCVQHSIQGINLLEYQPRDLVLLGNDVDKVENSSSQTSHLLVATPQALVSHSIHNDMSTENDARPRLERADIENVQLESLIQDKQGTVWALSTGPWHTELLSFRNDNNDEKEQQVVSRIKLQETPSRVGSMVLIPSVHTDSPAADKLYIYLDGTLHTYQLPTGDSITRTGSINMKVLNQYSDDAIVAMEYLDGITYLLRSSSSLLEAWDLQSSTLLYQMELPQVGNEDEQQWVGLALERRREHGEAASTTNLRSRQETRLPSAVYLHMSLDSYPPQLWSFRMTEEASVAKEEGREYTRFDFPSCAFGAAAELN